MTTTNVADEERVFYKTEERTRKVWEVTLYYDKILFERGDIYGTNIN